MALAFSLAVAQPVVACTVIFEPGPPGETQVKFSARLDTHLRGLKREWQERRWQEADLVFLARVMSLRLASESDVRVSLRPIVQIRGDERLPDTVLDQYDPAFGSTCGPTEYGLIGDLVIVYADRATWRTSPLQWGQPRISGVLPIYRNRDPQIAVALREAAGRLRQNEQ